MSQPASSSTSTSSTTSSSSLALPPRTLASPLPLYLDYNATTPLREEVVQAMSAFLIGGVQTTTFGNPSSSHIYGRSAKDGIEIARSRIARCLDAADPSEIVVLSGATESLNYAIVGGAQKQSALGRGRHIISCNIEHVATLEILRHMESLGFSVTILPVDAHGRVSAQQVADAIRHDTVLISLMLANNEVGSILPLKEIAAAVRKTTKRNGADIWIHTDASQAIGKLRVSVQDLDCDLLTVAGHKLYAPKGIGCLYIRSSRISAVGGLQKFMVGANHENDRRGGTENVIASVGLGAACELVTNEIDTRIPQFTQLRTTLLTSITDNIARLKQQYRLLTPMHNNIDIEPRYDFIIHGHRDHTLSNTLSIGFHGLRASELLHRLRAHIAASAGAACHSDTVTLSYVLAAMKVPVSYGMGTVRLSVGTYLTLQDCVDAGEWIAKTVITMWCEQRDALAGGTGGVTTTAEEYVKMTSNNIDPTVTTSATSFMAGVRPLQDGADEKAM